ncbi:MAG TPA: mismatch-specific DNA-glycosylase [Capillimicrobium sp.]
MSAGRDVLPDVVQPGLRLLLCGSAAGAVAARKGLPYSGPGNRFWRTLHEVGLTPRLLDPAEFAELPRHGIGLTDLCKTASGADSDLPPEADDAQRLRATVLAAAPEVLAFVGKRAASVALGRRVGAYGAQPDRFAGAETWVVPSTSGLAVRWWTVEPWAALAARVR